MKWCPPGVAHASSRSQYVLLVERGHGVREGNVELRLVSHGELSGVGSVTGLGRVALRKGIDEVLLEVGETLLKTDGSLDCVMATSKTGRPVVTGTDAVSHSPHGHGALGVLGEALGVHGDSLLVVIVELEAESEAEELAGFFTGAGDLGGEGPVGG